MTLSVSDYLEGIRTHTLALGSAATGNLDAQVEHCPDWTVGDLVHHLTVVHTFWEHVARTRPLTEPTEVPEVPRAADADLVEAMTAAMERMVATLSTADQEARCWTWGLEENVGFVTRHQVQEAAVHHWDAAHAAGAEWSMDDDVAMDAVEEFLTHSVANRRWPSPKAEPLGGTLWFCPCFADSASCPIWHVTDGDVPGTLSFHTYPADAPEIVGAADGDHVYPPTLLLWLYRRVPDRAIASGGQPPDEPRPLLQRFRAFTNTD